MMTYVFFTSAGEEHLKLWMGMCCIRKTFDEMFAIVTFVEGIDNDYQCRLVFLNGYEGFKQTPEGLQLRCVALSTPLNRF